ncbi:MAG: sugar ABC transporter permease [Clostridiales bacterium]|nr:sugar ABC transporter permease [Clostridiales bacterium]
MINGININKKANRNYNKKGLIFILPSLLGLFIFIFIPFSDVVIRSFQDEITREFIGIGNYKDIFTNNAYKLALLNTVKFTVICIPLLLLISLTIAVLLNRFVNIKVSHYIKTSFLLTYVIPTASVVLIWKLFFHEKGLINAIFFKLGFEGIDWMNTKYAFWVLVGSYLWKNIGYSIILWLTGINAINKEMIEGAMVDGAGEWKIFTKIMLPNLKTSFYIITVISIINSFKVFREAYLVGGNYPDESMYMLQHLFNNWFVDLSFGKIAAASVIVAIFIALLIVVLQKQWKSEY